MLLNGSTVHSAPHLAQSYQWHMPLILRGSNYYYYITMMRAHPLFIHLIPLKWCVKMWFMKLEGVCAIKNKKWLKSSYLKKLVNKNIDTKNDLLCNSVLYVTWCFCLATLWHSRFIGTLPDSRCVGSAAFWMYFSQRLARWPARVVIPAMVSLSLYDLNSG